MRLQFYRFLLFMFSAAVLLGGISLIYRDQEDPEIMFQQGLSKLDRQEKMKFQGTAAIRTPDTGLFQFQFDYSGSQEKQHPSLIEINNKTEKSSAGLTLTNRWNPLTQMTVIEQTPNKSFRAEYGAPRGKQIIRIELDGQESLSQLKTQLQEEMKEIQREIPALISSVPDEEQKDCLKELNALYEENSQLLNDKLSNASATSVYHILIDKKTSLPVRLFSENTIIYTGKEGSEQKELLVTDVYIELNP